MLPVAFKLGTCFFLGIALTQSWLPVRAGFLGALVLIAGAYRQRSRWQGDPFAPDAAERSALLSSAGTLVCLGYFFMMVYSISSGLDMHSREMRKMANELWILIAGSMAAQWIAQVPYAIRDELDANIAARALSAACHLLLIMQIVLIVWFGLVLEAGSPLRSTEMLTHLFIGSWMVAHVFYNVSCMHAYSDLRTTKRKIS